MEDYDFLKRTYVRKIQDSDPKDEARRVETVSKCAVKV